MKNNMDISVKHEFALANTSVGVLPNLYLRSVLPIMALWACVMLHGLLLSPWPVFAADVKIPNLWDPKVRTELPALPRQRVIRVLTNDDYPPMHFTGPDGVPTGFSVELARAACDLLKLACTIQPRRFDTLLDALGSGAGDVLAAAVPITADIRTRFRVTAPYHRTPARFVTWQTATFEISPSGLASRLVGVVAGSAHEAFLSAFFPAAQRKTYPSLNLALGGFRRGEVEAMFGDGLAMSLWLAGKESGDCCAFRGGPYLESKFFGEGVGFVMRTEDDALRIAFDHALQQLWDRGVYAELYLRFFPIGIY
jgi:polar amino acid transport system substrate-binding protein